MEVNLCENIKQIKAIVIRNSIKIFISFVTFPLSQLTRMSPKSLPSPTLQVHCFQCDVAIPLSPRSPFSPRGPGSPGAPRIPGSPFLPALPLRPRLPGTPGAPFTQQHVPLCLQRD